MDITTYTQDALLSNLKTKLDENCIILDENNESYYENLAMCSEAAMDDYLKSGSISKDIIKNLIKNRNLFPCYFGSALKQDGIDKFYSLIDEYTLPCSPTSKFGAKVFKITQDEQGNRLTHIKITGGALKIKQILQYKDTENNDISEKINSIRIYSGNKFITSDLADQGTVCAIVGLTKTYSGQGFGFEYSDLSVMLEPVFSYKV